MYLIIGAYSAWMGTIVGTGTRRSTLEYSGFFWDRFALVVPVVLAIVANRIRQDKRIVTALLAIASLAVVIVPPVRFYLAINAHAEEFVPMLGYHLTMLSGIFFASAATAAYLDR
ncbi:hypothetical protein [Halosimplex sp. J119]